METKDVSTLTRTGACIQSGWLSERLGVLRFPDGYTVQLEVLWRAVWPCLAVSDTGTGLTRPGVLSRP